jgi:MFS family permease
MFVFSAGISVVAVLLSLGVKLPRVKVEETHVGRPKISDLVQVSAIPVCLVTALIFFCYSGVSSYAVGFAAQQGFTTISAFFMVYAIVIVVSRPIAGKRVDAKGENSTIYLTMALLVVGLAMMALAPNGAIFLASAAALGVGVGTTQSIVQAIVAREAQPSEQGRANSTFMMSLDIGSGLGPMPLGALLGFVTYRQMYGLLAVVAVITIVVYYLVHGRKAR